MNSKWIKDLNVRATIIKLLEENICRTLFDINHKSTFLDLHPEVKDIKARINKWDLVKLKSFCTTKKTIDKMKTQPTEWEKMSASDMTSKCINSSHNSASKNKLIKKWAAD